MTSDILHGPRWFRMAERSPREGRPLVAAGPLRDHRLVIRKAFRMAVDRGQEAEYAKRHQPIWRELEDVLLDHGVRSYSIYLDPDTNALFAYVEYDDETAWRAIAETDVCRRWWRYMREIMPANPDDSPASRELSEVFHLEPI